MSGLPPAPPYAVRLEYVTGSDFTIKHETLAAARAQCTATLEGEYNGFAARPIRVVLLVLDAGTYRAVWSAEMPKL